VNQLFRGESNTANMSAVFWGSAANAPSDEWRRCINSYLSFEIVSGRPQTTVRLRGFHLAHMARTIGCQPGDVTEARLLDWFARQQWAVETRRSYRTTVRNFYTHLHRVGLIEHNPAAALPKIRPEKPLPRPAPDSAWTLARVRADDRTLLMLRLAGEAGLRRSEVAQVRTDDLRDGPSLLVHGKGSKERIVPITEDLAAAIAAGAAGHTPGAPASGWLFPGERPGTHLTAKRVGALVSDVLPPGWTMHTLRHRFATRAYRASRNLRAVQQLLGHESVATTERYLAVDDAEMRAAMLGAVGESSPLLRIAS